MKRAEGEAVVLEVQTREEAHRGVSLLIETGELLQVHAPSAAASRRRFGGALDPGTTVRAAWRQAREGGRWTLERAAPVKPPPHPDPLERHYAAAHLLELFRHFAHEGLADPRAYRLLEACLDRLRVDWDGGLILRYAECWVLRLAGLLPELGSCAECGKRLAEEAWLAAGEGACCEEHRRPGAARLRAASLRWMAATREAGPAEVPRAEQAVVQELGWALPRLIEEFTGRRLRAARALAALDGKRGE